MATPTLVFNNSTGSDTLSSGAGPSTALNGNNASLNSTTTVDLSADSPDLSGVATDGSHVIWVESSSGRKWSKITAVDNTAKTVTVDVAYSVTESTRRWAIGGKRNNPFSDSQLWSDVAAGWTIDIEETGTDYTGAGFTTGASGNSTNGYITIKSSSPNKPKITNSLSSNYNSIFYITNSYWQFENLQFDYSGTGGLIYGYFRVTANTFMVKNCHFTTSSSSTTKGYCVTYNANSTEAKIYMIDCACTSSTYEGLVETVNTGLTRRSGAVIINCYVKNSSKSGILLGNATRSFVYNTIVTGCSQSGIRFEGPTEQCIIIGNTIHNNTSDGISITDTAQVNNRIHNNNITSNGGYGINVSVSIPQSLIYEDFNNFGTGSTANTSGDVNGFTKGPNSINVDPQYTNATNGDFSVGVNVKAKGLPSTTKYMGSNQSQTKSYVDIGAAQRQESGGSVTLIKKPIRVI